MWNSALRKGLIAILGGIFATFNIFILVGEMGTRLSFYEV